MILGASSPTGKVLLKRLLPLKNIEINCYVRSPEKLHDYKNINIIKGDVTDYSNLVKSMKGIDLVITFLNGENLVTQAEAIVKSMKDNNIKRIIWMTGMGIHHEVPGPIKELLDKLVQSRYYYVQAADIIMKSGLDYTLLRGAHLTDNNNSKYYIQKEGKPLHCNTCDRIAIAHFICTIIENLELYKNESIGLTN